MIFKLNFKNNTLSLCWNYELMHIDFLGQLEVFIGEKSNFKKVIALPSATKKEIYNCMLSKDETENPYGIIIKKQ
jgi:hypothetical protein